MKKALFCAGLLASGAFAPAYGQVVLDETFQNPDSLKGWTSYITKNSIVSLPEGGSAVLIELSEKSSEPGTYGINRKLDASLIAGKRVLCSVEAKGENIAAPKQPWNGAKFLLALSSPGAQDWPQGKMKTGTFSWEKTSFPVNVAFDVDQAKLHLGFQDSYGKLYCRNLKVEVTDSMIDLRKAVNFSYSDDVAGDGKGGWSDQGPDNDARNFDLKKNIFGNVPFMLINPAKNDNKGVMVFKSGKIPTGIEKAEINLAGRKISGKYLYILHTLCWGPKAGTVIGKLLVKNSAGASQSITIESGRDVADWWNPGKIANGYPGADWKNSSGGRVGMYVSKFALDKVTGELTSIEFMPETGSSSIWIVAAATVSNTEYQFPEAVKFTVKADAVWKVPALGESPCIATGSALDRSIFLPAEKVGVHGRVIANKEGHLAFEKDPSKPIRFLTAAEGSETLNGRGGVTTPQLDTKESTEKFVKQLRANGYNMVRMHFLDWALMGKSKNNLEFDPATWDKFEYLVYCMKENGIYLNLDGMSSWMGYTPGSPWSKEGQSTRFKFTIHFDDKVKENWRAGVEKLLTKVNPYTKTRLIDDPVLAIVICFNEQEFGFLTPGDFSLANSDWKNFLSKKYGSFDKLKAAWGKEAPEGESFDSVPTLTKDIFEAKNQRGADASEFLSSTEMKTDDWYTDVLRKLGYKGLISNYNMGKSLRNTAVRRDMDIVTMNSYHAHPSKYMEPGSVISQDSSIANAGGVFRSFVASKMSKRPYAITEHNNVFWNQYRYEQGFVTGAYSAFQGFDALTFFSNPVTLYYPTRMHPFSGQIDPMMKTSEFLTFYMFMRGDIKTADSAVRLNFKISDIYKNMSAHDGVPASQSRLALICGFSTECLDEKGARFKPAPKELDLNLSGSAAVITSLAGFSSLADTKDMLFDTDKIIAELKKQKIVPENNKTQAVNEIFENTTGELFMNCRKNFMSVNTSRLQGICAEAGTKSELPNLKVNEMSVRGNIAVVSVDKTEAIADSKRLVLICSTNALNSNMVFDDKDMVTLRNIGTSPVIVQTGKFDVSVKNKNASKLKVWALNLSGERVEEIPVSVKDGEVQLKIDTAALKKGPSVFFELASE